MSIMMDLVVCSNLLCNALVGLPLGTRHGGDKVVVLMLTAGAAAVPCTERHRMPRHVASFRVSRASPCISGPGNSNLFACAAAAAELGLVHRQNGWQPGRTRSQAAATVPLAVAVIKG